MPQISWFSATGEFGYSEKVKGGIDVGLIIDHYFSSNYSLISGLSISTISGDITYTDSIDIILNSNKRTIPPNEKTTYKLKYLKIPLGLKLKSKEIGFTKYYTEMGVNALFGLKATASFNSSNDEKIENDVGREEINIFNLAYYIGGGLDRSIGGNTVLTMGIYYSYGLFDLTSNEESTMNLNIVRLLIGILF